MFVGLYRERQRRYYNPVLAVNQNKPWLVLLLLQNLPCRLQTVVTNITPFRRDAYDRTLRQHDIPWSEGASCDGDATGLYRTLDHAEREGTIHRLVCML